ncbi:ribosomal maturation YjgA family protein [Aequorivita echinoideorum]|uniref:DUF2809 domain-containing protein n=1 Tax=Aequorivita echinoideorum TaxID=1549647 RepID=A0ABS5S6I8_9FLAO|nr:DUF2809 domain-containing protein [Aequorivita echinoideorum]MBT0608824.1 DUF2809 domain-containing protein [Aequorivita echinoideorum]
MNYFLIFLALFGIEILIATLPSHSFVRGFIGDALVVVLLFYFCKIFINVEYFKLAIAVLGFAFLVEILQFFEITEKFQIESKLLLIIIGSVFDPWDFLAYFIGFLFILFLSKTATKI